MKNYILKSVHLSILFHVCLAFAFPKKHIFILITTIKFSSSLANFRIFYFVSLPFKEERKLHFAHAKKKSSISFTSNAITRNIFQLSFALGLCESTRKKHEETKTNLECNLFAKFKKKRRKNVEWCKIFPRVLSWITGWRVFDKLCGRVSNL